MITQTGYQARVTSNQAVIQPNVWVGAGGTADCAKVWGQGITSVAYNSSTGKYLITFAETGYQVPCIKLSVYGTGTEKWNVKTGGYSAANKTLVVWVYDDTTLTALATTAWLCIDVTWCDSTSPQ